MNSIIPAQSLMAIAQSLERSPVLPDRNEMLKNMSAALAGLQSINLPDRSDVLKNLSAAIGSFAVTQKQLGLDADSPQPPTAQSEMPDAQP